MGTHGEARTPHQIAAAVEAAKAEQRARELKRQQAGLLNLSEGDGVVLVALIRELLTQRMTKGHKRPRLVVETDLTLCFHARVGREPVTLAVPTGAELIRHPGNTFVLTDGTRSLRVSRTSTGIKLDGYSGFKELSGSVAWRHAHGTRYTRSAATRI